MFGVKPAGMGEATLGARASRPLCRKALKLSSFLTIGCARNRVHRSWYHPLRLLRADVCAQPYLCAPSLGTPRSSAHIRFTPHGSLAALRSANLRARSGRDARAPREGLRSAYLSLPEAAQVVVVR
jgi:hypothetical protein